MDLLPPTPDDLQILYDAFAELYGKVPSKGEMSIAFGFAKMPTDIKDALAALDQKIGNALVYAGNPRMRTVFDDIKPVLASTKLPRVEGAILPEPEPVPEPVQPPALPDEPEPVKPKRTSEPAPKAVVDMQQRTGRPCALF